MSVASTATRRSQRGERMHFLDSLRAGLMVLGIPFHASLVFSGTTWLLESPDSSALLLGLGNFIHLWRMPTFFIIAGYFALAVVRRRGSRPWFKGRLKRLGIPLLFAVVLVNPLQMLVMAAYRNNGWPDVSAAWLERLGSFDARWVEHLWFLVELLGYCLLVAALHGSRTGSWLAAKADQALQLVARSWALVLVASLVVAGAVIVSLAAWEQLNVRDYVYPVLSRNIALYFPFFVLGLMLALRPEYMQRMTSTPRPVTAVIGVVVVAVFLVLDMTVGWASNVELAVKAALMTVGAVYSARLLFAFARLTMNRSNRLVRWLVDSSLVVYIFHHLFVLLYGSMLIGWGVPALPAFVALVVLVFVSSAAVYELVALVPAMRFLTAGTSKPTASILRP